MSKSVPKFGSFKPKGKASKTGAPGPRDLNSEAHHADVRNQPIDAGRSSEVKRSDNKREQRNTRQLQSRLLDSSESARRHPDHERQHGRSEESDGWNLKNRRTVTEDVADSDHYFVDRRGDAKNVDYGTLHRYSIPQYHRTGYGRLIGIPSAKIDRDESTDKHIVLLRPITKHNEQNRSLLSTSRSRTSKEKHYRVVVSTAAEDALVAGADYVDLSTTASRKRKRGENEHQIAPSSRMDVDYRSIEGKAKPEQQPEDEDLQEESSSDDLAEEDLASDARQRSAMLTKTTKERPTDTEAWLALIEHQSQLIRPDIPSDCYTSTEKRALADVRLSMYDRALTHVPAGSSGHEHLVLGMLEQGSILWEGLKLKSKWNEVLGQNAGSLRLWTKYLDFLQTDHASFRFENCKAAYLKCFEVLGKALELASGAELEAVYKVQVYVLLRYTTFLRDAGYDELAHGVWQVLLEYHIFKPPGPRNVEQALGELEMFWDSDAPRIGEMGARGWKESVGKRLARANAALLHKASPVGVTSASSRLVEAEQDTLDSLHLPATNDHDESIDDPFRYVMFTDLRETVVQLATSLATDMLISAFLSFLHLPPIATVDDGVAWNADEFIYQTGDDDNILVQCITMTTRELFTTAFNGYKKHKPDHVMFADRTIHLLIGARPEDEQLAEYYLAFKLALMPDEAAQAAKKLLKARASRLRLYNAYALIEAKRGQLEKAVEVWSTALKMSAGFDVSEQDTQILLWYSWLHTLVLRTDKDAAALQLISGLCDNDADRAKTVPHDSDRTSASRRIKAKQYLESGFERMISKSRLDLAVMYAACHMWFHYIANDHALDAAFETRKQYSARLKRLVPFAGFAEAILLQYQAYLIQHHLNHHRPYKPATLRADVAKGLRAFPTNSSLIKLYQHLSASIRINDQIRASLHHDLLAGPEATIVGWSHAIDHELRRYQDLEATGLTENSVRSLFTRALISQESKARHAIVLWRSWLRFEVAVSGYPSAMQRKKALARAKQVFLDGMRALPWSKAWIVEGLGVFVKEGGMTEGEMRMVVEVMRKRELRIRMPVDELDEEAEGD